MPMINLEKRRSHIDWSLTHDTLINPENTQKTSKPHNQPRKYPEKCLDQPKSKTHNPRPTMLIHHLTHDTPIGANHTHIGTNPSKPHRTHQSKQHWERGKGEGERERDDEDRVERVGESEMMREKRNKIYIYIYIYIIFRILLQYHSKVRIVL